MKILTTEELKTASVNYDNVVNEGAGGFNPYRAELERRSAKITLPQTRDGRKDKLRREIEHIEGSIARESGMDDPDAAALLRAELAEIQAEEKAEFAAEWTPAVTAARRAEWNTWLQSQGRTVTSAQVRRQERAQGWTMAELKTAVASHN